jgi:NTE family protein
LLNSDEYREERLHRIGGAGKLESFDAATKQDVSWPFLTQLRDLGRSDAKAWLEANFDSIGVESTLDIDKALQREPARTT